jgi:hypothetical protein
MAKTIDHRYWISRYPLVFDEGNPQTGTGCLSMSTGSFSDSFWFFIVVMQPVRNKTINEYDKKSIIAQVVARFYNGDADDGRFSALDNGFF